MLAYGTSFVQGMGGMARMVDRILKGAKPGDMPDLQIARQAGITIPEEVLVRANKVSVE